MTTDHTPAPADAAINTRDLVKTFGRTRALDGFTLTVPTGQAARDVAATWETTETTCCVLHVVSGTVPPSALVLTIAVLMLCNFTASGSHTPYFFISAIPPVSPLMPQLLPPSACLARRSVKTRTGLLPAFWTSVRGMTSSASAIAL